MRRVVLEDIEVKVWRSHIKIPMIVLLPALLLISLYVILYFGANSGMAKGVIEQQVGQVLGGDVGARELVIEPDLSEVHLYHGHLAERGARDTPVVAVEQIHLELSTLGLLNKHIHITRGRAIRPDVSLDINEEGELNLLRALGLYEPPEDPDAPPGEMPVSLTFEQVSLEDGEFNMRIDGIFEVEIPHINISDADLRITNEILLIDVGKARTPRGNLRFYNELFGFPEESGDWTFGVDDFQIDQWRWSNSGFTVERFSGLVEGYTVEAGGHMGFPASDDIMTWGGEGEITAPFWSPLIHYFVGETLHYSIPDFQVRGEGTLNWVESRGELYADRVDAAGIQISDLHANVAIHDQLVEVSDARFDLYGGAAQVDRAYFDMFELVYSGQIHIDDVDLAGLTEDFFELEASYLKGDYTGGFAFNGTFPESLDYNPQKDTLYEHATDRWVDLTFTEPLRVKRESDEVIPAREVVIEEGARAWVDQDRAVVPEARVVLDGQDVFDVDEMTVHYGHYTFEPYLGAWGGRVRGRIADLTPYITFYDIEDVQAGVTRADVRLRGPLLSPDARGTLSIEGLQIGQDFEAQQLDATFDVAAGKVTLDEFAVQTQGGIAELDGWVDLMRRGREPDPEWGFVIYHIQDDAPLDMTLKTRQFDLAAAQPWVPSGIDLRGKASLDARASGRLDALLVCSDFSSSNLGVYGERFDRVSFHGELRDPGVKRRCRGDTTHNLFETWDSRGRYVVVEELVVEHTAAGVIRAEGLYGLNGQVTASLATRGFEPGQLANLLPYQMTGTFEAAVDVSGKITAPSLAGSLRGKGLGVMSLSLGDLALTMDTLEREVEGLEGKTETERTIHLAGGLLPWMNVVAEIPQDLDLPVELRSPVYSRFDVQDFDFVEFIQESGVVAMLAEDISGQQELLARLRQLQRAEVSGSVELFLPSDYSSVTVLGTLDELQFGPPRLGLRNRDPVVWSYRLGEGEESILIDSLTLGRAGRFIEVGGGVTPADGFVDLSVEGSFDLGILMALRRVIPDFLPEDIVDVKGHLDVSASFRGLLDNLLAQGELSWSPTTMVWRSLSEPVVIREGKIEFTPEQIRIPESNPINGSMLGGAFSVDGQMALANFTPGAFKFDVWAHNIAYAIPETMNVTLDTDLVLTARDPGDFSTWKVAGDVEVLDGLFYQDISVLERELTGRVLGAFNRTTEVYEASIFDEVPELEQIELDLALKARDGFKLKNQIDRFGLDLEFRIDLVLASTIEALRLTGDVDVIDGDVLFQGETFVVRTGTVRFSGDAGRPFVDVVAVADIRNACRASALQDEFTGALALNGAVTTTSEVQDEVYQISLNVNGNSDNLNILYDSVPFADQRDILSLILTGCTVDLLTASSASQPTLETLLGPLIGRLEREIQEVVRVEEFNITPGVNRTQVLISDDLTRRLSWRFQLDKTFNQANSTGQSGQLEYQLTDRLAAIFEESSYSDLNTPNRFQLDLKLKFRMPLD